MTPCATCPKIPAKVYDADGQPIEKIPGNYKKLRPHAVDMNDRMRAAWAFDRECKAVGQFPDDPIVRSNAVLIRDAEREAAEDRQAERDRLLFELMAAMKGGR